MDTWGFMHLLAFVSSFILLLLSHTCLASLRLTGSMNPGFKASQMSFIDNDGLFLLSNNSNFAFGFQPTIQDVTFFYLIIIHIPTSVVVWTANRGFPVRKSDYFVFDENGKVSLDTTGGTNRVWSPDTGGNSVSAIQMLDSGNLVLIDDDASVLWQSFDHPTDTVLSGQEFKQGMKLSNGQNVSSLSFFLEIISGDMILYANFTTPQHYWSMVKDSRRVINKRGGEMASATMEANSWKFYDKSKDNLWQFIFSTDTNPNITRAAILGTDGTLSFYSLRTGGTKVSSTIKIPGSQCMTPRSCDPYYMCSSNKCQCPSGLISRGCKTGITDPCKDSSELIYAGDGLSYFGLEYNPLTIETDDLDGCKDACVSNCSCLALFFANGSGSCFLFDGIGSFRSDNASSLAVYVKVSTDGPGNGDGGDSNMNLPVIITMAILTALVVLVLISGGYMYNLKKKKRVPLSAQEYSSEEDNFWEALSVKPVRFHYKDLKTATDNFSTKLGHGGFGSVYRGTLPDGTQIAVKKLEGIGQGKKEFRAEVSTIGSIHHVNLVKLRGFCAEGTHRLLAYDYMANGSLDKWIFNRSNKDGHLVDWKTWYNIALSTAKGLAYLHEDCDAKIIHCDIKPENVLLDDHFQAKVSDFGLAKLMTREQSHVFTTLRGTRGYLAPEWITNYAISEKSDVYSYGIVLLEIIGGRKNYDPMQSSHLPCYAFKIMKGGKIEEIIDPNLRFDSDDESLYTAAKVALWCIQEDMNLRPSMSNVVQMLEGMWEVPDPPTSSLMVSRLFAGLFRTPDSKDQESVTGTSSRPSECNGDSNVSDVQLSGPR